MNREIKFRVYDKDFKRMRYLNRQIITNMI